VEGPWITYTNGDNVRDFRTLMDKMFYNMEDVDTIAWTLELLTGFFRKVIDTDGAIGLLYMYEGGN
jgi:hypothetical protein